MRQKRSVGKNSFANWKLSILVLLDKIQLVVFEIIAREQNDWFSKWRFLIVLGPPLPDLLHKTTIFFVIHLPHLQSYSLRPLKKKSRVRFRRKSSAKILKSHVNGNSCLVRSIKVVMDWWKPGFCVLRKLWNCRLMPWTKLSQSLRWNLCFKIESIQYYWHF